MNSQNKKYPIELLAPARNSACGITAINCGADAVYTGAPRFGARSAAGNSIADIEALAAYAHRYHAKVYAALNTILRDDELDDAVRIARELWNAGIDGLIIQDMGLLMSGLPPVPLIASTQCDNDRADKIEFLGKVGFSRVILARELSLGEIRTIRARTAIELEAFIHGALCVSYSGRCYMSYAIGGRSGNRGECAQPCRKKYSVIDESGKTVAAEAHLLSPADMNRSDLIGEMIDAGISSFKIEGRLKDESYIKTVTSYYRAKIDQALTARAMSPSSDGYVTNPFDAKPEKVFNRGFTPCFISSPDDKTGSFDTPKWKGEKTGKVAERTDMYFILDHPHNFIPGDGIAFFDSHDVLSGTNIVKADMGKIFPNRMNGIESGTVIYRNFDKKYHDELSQWKPRRAIPVTFTLSYKNGLVSLSASDGHGNTGHAHAGAFEGAAKTESALETITRQISKLADTEFSALRVDVEYDSAPPFIPVAELNALRRHSVEDLRESRLRTRPTLARIEADDTAQYFIKEISFEGNVLNDRARRFYELHGATVVERAAESGLSMKGRRLMTTKHCLRRAFGICLKTKPDQNNLFLVDEHGVRYPLRFNCAECVMEIYNK